jgi:drug/metabolite transporter (DMT)-like permease
VEARNRVTILTATYPNLSVAVGVAMVGNAFLIGRARWRATPVTLCLGLLEFLWAVVSVIELIDRPGSTPVWLPISFLGWFAVGTLVGITSRRRRGQEARPDIPHWYSVAGGGFGAYFCAASLWLTLGTGAAN